MDAVLGSVHYDQRRIAPLGQPNTGGPVLYSLTNPTGTAVITAQAMTHLGDGVWQYVVPAATLTLPGTWRRTWTYSDAQGGAYSEDAPLVVGPWQPGMKRRWELRHAISDSQGHLTLGSISAIGANTLTDADRWEPNDHFNGQSLGVYAGQGRHQQPYRVTDFAAGVYTLHRNWLVNPAVDGSSRYEAHRHWSIDQLNRAINRAIEEGADSNLVLAEYEAVTLSADTYEYTVPAGFVTLAEVWILSTTATGADADWVQLSKYDGDWALRPGRTLYLAYPRAAHKLRLVGQLRPAPLETDDALCELPEEWVIARALMHLLAGRMTGAGNDVEAAGTRAAFADRLAGAGRPRITALPGAEWVY